MATVFISLILKAYKKYEVNNLSCNGVSQFTNSKLQPPKKMNH
jgi:hypothetical protein